MGAGGWLQLMGLALRAHKPNVRTPPYVMVHTTSLQGNPQKEVRVFLARGGGLSGLCDTNTAADFAQGAREEDSARGADACQHVAPSRATRWLVVRMSIAARPAIAKEAATTRRSVISARTSSSGGQRSLHNR